MREAIELHLEGMREDGLPIRNPQVSLITSKPHERTMLILSTLLDDSDLRASALICG